MSYTVEETKEYPHAIDTVYQAAKGAVEGLEGKFLTEDQEKYVLDAKFHKTIHGKVLGDRSRFEITLTPKGEGETELNLVAYPLNAVGEKLLFGARKGVLATVIRWFYAHLDHRLPK